MDNRSTHSQEDSGAPTVPEYNRDEATHVEEKIEQLTLDENSPDLKIPPGYSANEYWDVLPSFQMYQSILRRHLQNINHDVNDELDSNHSSVQDPDEQDNHSITDAPPDYPVVGPPSAPMLGPTVGSSNARITTTDIHNQPFSPQLTPTTSRAHVLALGGLSDPTTPAADPNTQSTFDSVIDSVDSLKRVTFSPIDVQIFVTKQIPKPQTASPSAGNDPNLENKLKEYTNADFVYGYIIIHNTSTKPIPFEMFTVSLEGTEVITSLSRPVKFVKKFLRMFDLSACWSYDTIINSLGIEYEHFSKDSTDHSIYLGLPDNRILKPNTKYKKFFTFKFPQSLLDNTCPHIDQLQHYYLPPSLGLDKSLVAQANKDLDVSGLVLNKALGYAYLDKRGSPLLTRDYALSSSSIQYTIEARFIGKKNDGKLNIEDMLNYKDMHRHFIISAATNYHLRFIPNMAYQSSQTNLDYEEYLTNLIKIESNSKKQLKNLQISIERLLGKLEHEKKKMERLRLRDGKDEPHVLDGLKASQMYSTPSGSNIFTIETPGSSRVMSPELSAYSSRNLNLYEEEFEDYYSAYLDDDSLITSLATFEMKKFLSSKKGLIKLTFNKMAGEYNKKHYTDKIPPVPYMVAPLISKNNVSSEIHKRFKEKLRLFSDYKFLIDLEFQPTSGAGSSLGTSTPTSSNEKPPRLVSFQVSLLAITVKSERPIPVKLSPDFFLPDIHVNASNGASTPPIEVNDFNKKLKVRFAEYKEKLTAYQAVEGLDTASHIPKTLLEDVDSIIDLTHAVDEIPIFGINNYSSGKWERHVSGAIISLPAQSGLTHSISACLDDSMTKKTWRRKVQFTLDLVSSVKDSIVPSFQSCLISRLYCVRVKAVFDGNNLSYIDIPVDVL
ncbi:hypothetical protein BABINDRAFT_161914 [Babjeviella inositovora NRRL Y-12698]|uniref:Bul1 N-terminal domain-containing protein n=1 Tax=Babjeviella inositovora NRRL Y-12698 TaxID=984486 RepID=A0A1E3QPA2_9ASCO|nr:uncharacterized protein BABINDRAFT_161914 [Babjeviella inositovora NRRL Y-12698]ODQ79523.1 hypothetical protein BABINDRAFT_161914 [Babjeviella inositovora NRRL Y-12698]